MKFATVMVYHKQHERQAKIMSAYYEKFMDTYAMEADFTVMPAHEWRNKAMAMYPDYDYYLTLDSDEVLTADDIYSLSSVIEGHKPEVVLCKLWDYLSTNEIAPVRTHKPIIAIKKGKTFNDDRCANAAKLECKIILHHLGYLFNLPWKKDFYEKHNLLEKKKMMCIIEGKRQIVETPSEVKEAICQLSQ
jgi:hypothetical protein